MNITSITEDLDKIKDEYNQKVAQIREVGLANVFREFFEANPEIQAISFIGYIPGFNDGDPCVFGMGEVNFATQKADLTNDIPGYEAESVGFEGAEADKDWYYGWFNLPWRKEEQELDKYNDLREVNSFIQGNEGLIQNLFGTDFKVVITKDEIKVEEYDCGY